MFVRNLPKTNNLARWLIEQADHDRVSPGRWDKFWVVNRNEHLTLYVSDQFVEEFSSFAADELNSVGLYVQTPNADNTNAEILYARGPVESPFCVHVDNETGVDYCVHTFILYCGSDDMVGGNLDIYDASGEHVVQSVDVRSEDPDTLKYVMFSGNTPHAPRDLIAGSRFAFSIQIRQRTEIGI